MYFHVTYVSLLGWLGPLRSQLLDGNYRKDAGLQSSVPDDDVDDRTGEDGERADVEPRDKQ